MGRRAPARGTEPIPLLVELAEFRFRLRSFLSQSESLAEAAGITVQQYQLLQVVGAAGPAGCSISALAGRLLLRHHSAVELVDRAERAGLVQRTVDAADHRVAVIHMTAAGESTLRRLVAGHLAYLESAAPPLAESLLRLAPADHSSGSGATSFA